MTFLSPLLGRRFECACTVEIENTSESLHAHVELDGDFVVQPGDEVQVIDAPSHPPYGEKIVVRRTAVVTRASALERVWKAERFSWWFTSLMHRFPDGGEFNHRMQQAELDYLVNSTAASTALAENYVGLPIDLQ